VVSAIDSVFSNKALRKVLLEFRVILGIVLMAALIAWIDRDWFWPALAVSFAGEALQVWCFACLRKDKVLSVDGPYALCRNPMYIGRFFVILGGVMLLGNIWVVLGYAILYWFYVVNRVAREERKLKELLGEPYEDYCRQVHRFVPKLQAYPGARLLYFDPERFKKNNAFVNALAVAVFFGAAWYLTFVYDLQSHLGLRA